MTRTALIASLTPSLNRILDGAKGELFYSPNSYIAPTFRLIRAGDGGLAGFSEQLHTTYAMTWVFCGNPATYNPLTFAHYPFIRELNKTRN